MGNKELFPDMPKTIKYVQSGVDPDGLPLAYTGCSAIDDNDHHVTTYNLKGDQVPEVLMDSKTTAEYVEKLINADLNKKDGIWSKIK